MDAKSKDQNIPFLKWAAENISNLNGNNMMNTVVILPSQRACFILKEHLRNLMNSGRDSSFILPEIQTINKFWVQLSNYIIPDKDILLLELFKVYKTQWTENLEFEDFAMWGRMMLSDFDEIDKYNVDAKRLFSIIQDEKKIDALFSIEDELREILSHFINLVESDKELEKEFVNTWEIIGKVYPLFKEHLKQHNMAYEGMAYRAYYDEIRNDEHTVLPFSNIHFVGFNAFTEIDERLIKKIAESATLSMHWDVDDYFMDNPEHEAGNFLRKYKSSFSGIQHFWNQGDDLNNKRKYIFHGAPMNQGQNKVVKELLHNISNENLSTGIVLTDESVLESLLFEIGQQQQVNITMSLPAGQSSITDWLEILYKIHQTESIHKSDLERLYQHYFFRLLHSAKEAESFNKVILRSNTFYFSTKILSNYIPKILIDKKENILSLKGLCRYWVKQLSLLIQHIDDNNNQLKIILPYFIAAIQNKELQLINYENQISFKAIYQLLIAHIRSTQVPFISEKSRPIQIMGFLETRLMDFDKVIIMGANEEILPKSKRGNSYIPYSLRAPFGLPTLKEYDSVYAYHFFRLLKRTKEAHLVYNNTASENLQSEKSRFLSQILLELNSPTNQIIENNWYYPNNILKENQENLIIPKTNEHLDILKDKSFSPSALTLYIKCQVQFYLQYIAKIFQEDNTEEILSAADFGNVLHKALELIFSPLLNQLITSEIITQAEKEIDEHIKTAFYSEYQSFEKLKGKNLLAYDIIRKVIVDILKIDKQMASEEPFYIESLENEYRKTITLTDGRVVELQGKLDRVDRTSKGYRILDYKSGKINILEEKDFKEDKIAKIFTPFQVNPSEQTFQGLFYDFLLGKENTSIGFYAIRKLNDGIQFLNDGNNIPNNIRKVFEENLVLLLDELFNLEIPFERNPKANSAKYSLFEFMKP
ncbi:MAG: PD-(D/E)XK nuclease family protein [Chitinophagales bacterium]|nr:PD-(D/E)XK nuclease family protein [Chitinophagales bacterium]